MPTRRETILGGAMALLGSAMAKAAANTTSRERPNILWLVSEDNNPFIGAYGDRLAHTPTIDALAAKGVLYKNAFSTGPVCATSRFAILTGVHAESCGPAHHHRAVAHLPPELKTYPEYMREVGYYCTNNFKTDYNCDVDAQKIWNESSPEAQWYHRPAGTPFMSVYNYFTTHESQLFFETEGRVQPADVRVPHYLPDSPKVRRDIASYYNLIERMDSQLGDRLKQIETQGVADDTIIFYYSDNGGVLPRSKHFDYDEGYRTALVIYVPPKWQHLAPAPPGSVVRTPVSFADLAPTLLSILGTPKPAQMQGRALLGPRAGPAEHYVFGARDRMDERYDFCRTVSDGRYRLIRNYLRDRPGAGHEAYAWQMKSYQDWESRHIAGTLNAAQDRFFHVRPYEEFYDLEKDRDQIRDLITEPAHAGRIAAMRRALDQHMLEVRDNGFIPEGAPGEGYHESRNDAAYPLDRIMALAARAAAMRADNLDDLVLSAQDANPIVRYWGIIGLRFLGGRSSATASMLDRIMNTDPVMQVQIAAAGALVEAGQVEAALTRLRAILATPSQTRPLLLQTLDTLTYLGDRARPALAEITGVAKHSDPDIRASARYVAALLDGTYTPELPIYAATVSAKPLPPPPL